MIIIGAQKCGTTSLHYYMSLHPQIFMSRDKELNFFIEGLNWNRDRGWYASHFDGTAKIYGESSPAYTNFTRFRGVAARMHALLPEAKLIYIVRDPIQRMVSHYIHQYSSDLENRSIGDALGSTDNNEYVYRSLYYTQLEQYLAYYPASQILVITTEDLQQRRQSTLRKTFEFLEVNSDFYSRRYATCRHTSVRKRRKMKIGMRLAQTAPARILKRLPQHLRWPVEDLLYLPFSRKIERPSLTEALRNALRERVREDVNKLRKFTGQPFREWSL